MTGSFIDVLVKEGKIVEEGANLAIVEAMQTEKKDTLMLLWISDLIFKTKVKLSLSSK